MSTKEFDTKLAHDVVANYQCVAGGGWTERAASLLGPALDALSAARKERDEARASRDAACGNTALMHAQWTEARRRALDEAITCASWCRSNIVQAAQRGRHPIAENRGDDLWHGIVRDLKALAMGEPPARDFSPLEPEPTLASLAERVKAIEERIGGKDEA